MSYFGQMKKAFLLAFLFFILLTSCTRKLILKEIRALETDYQHHSGFLLYDLMNDKELIKHHDDKYFVPASNTKILTLYAAARVLPDSLIGIYYTVRHDSLVFWGSGDPSFLNSQFNGTEVYDFLKTSNKRLYFSAANYSDNHFGPGWAWDDYYSDYSKERSPFPVYGNEISVTKKATSMYLHANIDFFKPYFYLGDSLAEHRIVRGINSNSILYSPSVKEYGFNEEVPFNYTPNLVCALLTDTLGKKVDLIKMDKPANVKKIYTGPLDSALQIMMQESDNFIAEQLLLMTSSVISDTLSTEVAIDWAEENLLKEAPDKFIWIDGSGLSRYNLFTPRSVVWLWKQLYGSVGKERLFPLLAQGGKTGTLKQYYKSGNTFIYGKTGTLSNIHSLSGFLITKKGKVFVFSFMHSNYPTESKPIKNRMEKILTTIYERY